MRNSFRLRIQAAGRVTPPTAQLTEQERAMVFRAVNAVIESDGFLAQPGADLLVNLRSELDLDGAAWDASLGTALTPEELEESQISPSAADYLCYMAMLAGLADGKISESERITIDGFCDALRLPDSRRMEIVEACQRGILEANILMNLPDVICSSELAQRFASELNVDRETLEAVADSVLQSLAEA
jgi:hypothetical protein